MNHTEASCRNPRKRGFTVIELMVATVVLLVGIVGVSQMVTQAVDSDLRNRDTSSSMMAAQRELEQMLRLPIDANQLATPTDYSFTDTDGGAAYVGSLPAPATAPASAAPPGSSQAGCPLTANGDIDFTLSDLPHTLEFLKQLRMRWAPRLEGLKNAEKEWCRRDQSFPDHLSLDAFHQHLTLRMGQHSYRGWLTWCEESLRRVRARMRKENRDGKPVSVAAVGTHRGRKYRAHLVLGSRRRAKGR